MNLFCDDVYVSLVNANCACVDLGLYLWEYRVVNKTYLFTVGISHDTYLKRYDYNPVMTTIKIIVNAHNSFYTIDYSEQSVKRVNCVEITV